jgi:hypothetical protein
MTERDRIFTKLLKAHDAVYNAIEILEDLRATPELAAALEMMDVCNGMLEAVMENPWWKKGDDGKG